MTAPHLVPARSLQTNARITSPALNGGRQVRIIGVQPAGEGGADVTVLYEDPTLLGPVMETRVLGDLLVLPVAPQPDERGRDTQTVHTEYGPITVPADILRTWNLYGWPMDPVLKRMAESGSPVAWHVGDATSGSPS